MARMVGEAGPDGLAGKPISGWLSRASLPQFQRSTARVLSGEEVPPFPQRLMAAGRPRLEVDLNCSLIRYDGRPAILGVFTERRPTCSFLRAVRCARRCERLAAGMPAAVLAARSTGHVKFANNRFLEFTGFQKEDALETGWMEAIHEEERQICRESWLRAVHTGQPFHAEFRLRDRDGQYHWFRATGLPVENPKGRPWWCLTAVENQERQFGRLFEGRMAGVAIGTPDRIIEANDLFLQTLGRTRNDLNGKALAWSSVVAPEETEAILGNFQRLLQGAECPAFETALLRPDGTRVPVLLAAQLLARDPEPRMLTLVFDVTERQELQEKRAEKAREEMLRVLAGGMAHNLNNMLTAVIGNASLLLDRHLGIGETRPRALARDIVGAGQRAAELVQHLMDFAGHGRLRQGTPDPAQRVAAEIERLRRHLPPKDAIRLEIDPALPPVPLAPGQLSQIVDGLVTNAIEALDPQNGGEVSVIARLEKPGPAEGLGAGEYCLLEVRDNGCGMSGAILSRIFEPFFSTKFTGRGLGLAAIAGIVRAARGSIRVRSVPGEGSTFRVFLPVIRSGELPPD